MQVFNRRSIFSWCLYDWANSAFNTIIITFVFSVYFSRGIIGDETAGAALWSYAIGLSGLFIAILGPIMGAVADHTGDRKKWLFWLSLACIVTTSLLWFAQPSDSLGNVLFVMGLVLVANVAFELAQVFYNSMLSHVAPPAMMGRVSGWGWGLGYLGGLAALALILFGLIGLGEIEPFLPISGAESANVRASGPLTALWFLVFMMPLFLFTEDLKRSSLSVMESIKSGWKQLVSSLRNAAHEKNLVIFLISSALYRDGLVTLFSIGGVYAAGQYGMDFTEILIFAIGLNVTAGLGALAFSFIDDWLGSQKTVMIALTGLILCGIAILLTSDKEGFMAIAYLLGVFVGPVQAASRTLAGRLAPAGMVAQTYGLYAFSGKSVTFLGPLVYGAATSAFQTQQAGMISIILFWLVGLIMLYYVKERV